MVYVDSPRGGRNLLGYDVVTAAQAKQMQAEPTRACTPRLESHLDGGLVTLEADNLADKGVVADEHELVHGRTAHLLGRHDWHRVN